MNRAPSPVSAPHRDVIDLAFEQVYLEHAQAVHRSAVRAALGDYQRAEEATQDAFLEAWRDWPRFRLLPSRQQFSWLSKCARYRVIDSWRMHKGKAELPVDILPDQPAWETTEDLVLSKVTLDRFWKVVTAGPVRAARVAYLHWHEGWTKVTIAAHLDVDRATVHRDLAAVRAMVQEQLKDEALGSRREP